MMLHDSDILAVGPTEGEDARSLTYDYIKSNIRMKITKDTVADESTEITEVQTNCFGDVVFKGASWIKKAKFIRLSDETPADVIYELMIKHWKMGKPRFIVTVTGGAKNPVLKPNLGDSLLNVANTLGCWVISSGMNSGVVRHSGDAVQDSRDACVGILPWGVIKNRKHLLPNTDLLNERDHIHYYETEFGLAEKGVYLDSNHTHFLLVDDGSEGRYGVEKELRERLEIYLMENIHREKPGTKEVVTIYLVLEGSPDTISRYASAVSSEFSILVVIVQPSGGAANLLAYALSNCAQIRDCGDEYHEGLMEEIQKYSVVKKQKIGHNIYRQIIKCLEFEEKFTIWQMGDGCRLDDAILSTLLNDKSVSRYRQLDLTLAWNRVDLARHSIERWESRDGCEKLQWIMIAALVTDNVDFVELLIEYGVNIGLFLSKKLLEFLYGFRSHFKSSPLKYLLKENDYKPIPEESCYNNVYRHLCSQNEHISTEHVMIPMCDIERLCPFIRNGKEKSKQKDDVIIQYPIRELFYWALFNNMFGMAKLFLRVGEEHIAKALTGVRICDVLSQRMADRSIQISLKETARILKEESHRFLDVCSRTDDQNTRTLITYDLDQFNEMNVLTLAVGSGDLDFFSNVSVQGVLDEIWKGNLIHSRYTPYHIDRRRYMFDRPIVKFGLHVIGYVLFIILFAYVAMLQKTSQTISWTEWLLIVTIIAFLVAEVYQILQTDGDSVNAKLKKWASDGLNIYDAFVIWLFFVSLGLRLSGTYNVQRAGHVVYAIDCGFWILRLLSVCFVSPTVGPYLVMIKGMVNDLVRFLFVLVIVIVSYGVTTTAILSPSKHANIIMLRNSIWHPYFNIYGELFIDRDPENNSTTRFGTPILESYDETISWILLGIYLLFTNILLLNLLIAIFNKTYSEIQQQALQIWVFNRYHLIVEYAGRTVLFPPLSLLSHTFLLMVWVFRKCSRCDKDKKPLHHAFMQVLKADEKESILRFERKCMTIMAREKTTGR